MAERITTPIVDFVHAYAAAAPARLHMPGHKGTGPLGFEALDITEIDGADDLYAPSGLIAESQANASRLFGCPTFYSTEGASLALRAMLFLAITGACDGYVTGSSLQSPPQQPASAPQNASGLPVVMAGRNAHRTFLTAAALLDFDISWLPPAPGDARCACTVTPEALEAALGRASRLPAAVYVTSPDYLGNIADIAGLSRVCHRFGVPLLVDGAHGAYLRFLTPSRHPMDLGADLCCTSAHKTLPALTGAAYLHARDSVPTSRIAGALALFGSTSPSWLILQSLDALNPLLDGFSESLSRLVGRLDGLKGRLRARGHMLLGDEPMKLSLDARAIGTTGDALAARLRSRGLIGEYHDRDALTLMFSPSNSEGDLERLEAALMSVPIQRAGEKCPPPFVMPESRLSVRQALFAPKRTLPLEACEGRIMATLRTPCPPAVPIVMPGEAIDRSAVERMRYYGIDACDVVAAADERGHCDAGH